MASGYATVTSRVGEVTSMVRVTDEVMEGVVSLPLGWGRDLPGIRLSVASRRPGTSVNRLSDESAVDPISGNAVLNGIPVAVGPG